MKKTVTKFRLLLALGLLVGLFSAEKVQATHAFGADMTYVNMAPGVYMFTYKVYRECGGLPAAQTQTLTYRGTCASTVIGTATVNLNGTFQAQPYCAGIVATCTGSGNYPTFEEDTYSGVVTLNAPACTEWIVSASLIGRGPARNLANGGNENLYSEVIINGAVSNNNSPQFGRMPVPFIGVNLHVNYNHSVIEADGDSLVYSLQPALSDYGIPVTYAGSYPAGMSPGVPPSGGVVYPAGVFSATNPIISYQSVTLNTVTGNILMQPLSYIPPANAPAYLNKYVMVVQVDEYRNINGAPVKIGHVRRDMVVTVTDCGTNYLPRLGNIATNHTPFQPDTVINIAAGIPVIIEVTAEDDNPANVLTLTSNAADALPGATFTVSGGARPTGTITWTPTAAQLRSAPYFVSVTTTDNACPVKGFQTYSMGLRVGSVSSPTGISSNLPANSFVAFPNPANTSLVTFKLKADFSLNGSEVIIYNLAGKVVDKIAVKAGEEQIQWNKKADLPAGVYFARLNSTEGSQTIKLVHLK